MKNLKNRGWVRLHRKIEDNDLWFLEPFTKAQAWIDLFLNANHKDGIIQIRGNIVRIKRGQIGWSELTMVKRWKWSKNKVRRFLSWLEAEQQIEQQKDRFVTTIITILKYEEHQNDTADDTAERQQKDSRRYINKNDKNVKNDKNISKEIQTTSEYGNPLINKSIKYLEQQLGGSLDGSIQVNRNYANLLIKRFLKDYPDKDTFSLIGTLINAGMSDDFHAKNINGFKYLYYNAQKIIQTTKTNLNKTNKYKIGKI